MPVVLYLIAAFLVGLVLGALIAYWFCRPTGRHHGRVRLRG